VFIAGFEIASAKTVFSNILSLYTKWYERPSFMYKSISYIWGAQIPVPGGPGD